jgi:hypothetical protein
MHERWRGRDGSRKGSLPVYLGAGSRTYVAVRSGSSSVPCIRRLE